MSNNSKPNIGGTTHTYSGSDQAQTWTR